MKKSIAFLLIPGFQLLDMAGPVSVFESARSGEAHSSQRGYEVGLISERGGRLSSSSGVEVVTRSWRDVKADVVIAVGGGAVATRPSVATPALLRYLRAHSAMGKRVGSVCTGAFLLGAAGLLDGRRATTHWAFATTLQRQFPLVTVISDDIFIRDGDVWTSAGVTAGIDLALAMVEDDLGAASAAETARQIVVYRRRTGGQSQFSALQDMAPQSDRMCAVLAHITEHLTGDLSIECLASVACLSARQFIRAFKTEIGQTPAKAVERIRAEVAKAQIERGVSSIERVARATGFDDTERMRRAFIRVYGQPPQALRRHARATVS